MKMGMKGFCSFFIVFTLSIFSSLAQQHIVDSLKNAVKHAQEDTNKLQLLKVLSWDLSNYNVDTALVLDSEMLKLAGDLSASSNSSIAHFARKYTGIAWYYKGVFVLNKGDYTHAIEYNNKSREIFEEVGYTTGVSNTYNSMGIIYKEQGQYDKAMDCFFKCLKVDEEQLKNKGKLGIDYGNIGVIYNKLGENAKALDYYTKSLNIAREINDKFSEARNLDNIGTVYDDQHEYKKGLDAFLQSEKISEDLNDKNGMSTEMLNIGSVYYTLAQKEKGSKKLRDSLLDKSLYYSSTSLKTARELGLKSLINIDLVNLGSLLAGQGKAKEAEKDLLDAIAISDSIGALDSKKGAYEILSDVYRDEGDYKKAYAAYKTFSSLKDSVFNEDKNKEITRNEMNYQFAKREAEQKAAQDKKDAVVVAEKNKQQIIVYAVSAGLFLVLLLAAFIFRGYMQKQRANVLLEEQKQKVDNAYTQLNEKHKEITDSINYAKRIQQALFKDEEHVTRHLPEHYILFKPRDVVSGDFYWGFEKGDKWYVAAVDCTGHGVPGAFLTMLGSAFLNEICSQPNGISPAEILNQLREKVVKELSTYGEVKDGMDISLCSIPMVRNGAVKIEWAGANNPLWYLHKGEMKEIVADKQPIGYQDGGKPFTNHVVEVVKGDTLYLFTDGYADQFGGERGKKFKYKPLQEKLVEVASLNMLQQKQKLSATFDNWKGSLDQTDDVCIIGIRV